MECRRKNNQSKEAQHKVNVNVISGVCWQSSYRIRRLLMEMEMVMETVPEAKRVKGTVLMQVYMKDTFDKLKIEY